MVRKMVAVVAFGVDPYALAQVEQGLDLPSQTSKALKHSELFYICSLFSAHVFQKITERLSTLFGQHCAQLGVAPGALGKAVAIGIS